MTKQIAEIKIYQYDSKDEIDKEIILLNNSEWQCVSSYEDEKGKWIAIYRKDL